MSNVKVEIDKNTASCLITLFENVFKTGAAITLTVDFTNYLHYPEDADEMHVVVKPEKMTIEIR